MQQPGLEVILPLRNATTVLRQTVESLAAQSSRNFSVVLSDNYSTEENDLVAQAEARLVDAGIRVRKIRPPQELGRVEHWNWAHAQSDADWLKPLFCGDWLEPEAVERVRGTIQQYPQARFIHFGYQYHEGDTEPLTVVTQCVSRFRSPEEMSDLVLRFGHQFGPPNAVAIHRTAFEALGGFRSMLPICADSLLSCALACRFGVVGIPEVLCHFQLHGARFSMSLPGRPNALLREKLTYLSMLAYHAWTEDRRIPWVGFGRMLAREVRSYRRESAAARNAAP